MSGTIDYYGVFKQTYDICSSNRSFTKSDVDNMPPFERENIIQMLIDEHEEAEIKADKK